MAITETQCCTIKTHLQRPSRGLKQQIKQSKTIRRTDTCSFPQRKPFSISITSEGRERTTNCGIFINVKIGKSQDPLRYFMATRKNTSHRRGAPGPGPGNHIWDWALVKGVWIESSNRRSYIEMWQSQKGTHRIKGIHHRGIVKTPTISHSPLWGVIKIKR